MIEKSKKKLVWYHFEFVKRLFYILHTSLKLSSSDVCITFFHVLTSHLFVSFSLSICLFLRMSISISVYLSVFLSVSFSVCFFVCLSLCHYLCQICYKQTHYAVNVTI